MDTFAPSASARSLSLRTPHRDRLWLLLTLLWLAIVGIAGCTSDFRVRRVDPARTSSAGPANTQLSARRCADILRRGGKDPAAQMARREAASRLLSLYGGTLLTARDHTARLPTEAGQSLSLTLRRGDGPGGVDPADYVALEPADDFVVEHVDHLSRTSGEGVPLVGTLRHVVPVNAPGVVPARPTSDVMRALTAVASVGHGGSSAVTFSLYDPHTSHALLAADYTTPIACNLARFRPQRRGLRGLMRGNDYFDSTGLYALETPTPDKTPLVLVHGLISDPGDFYHLINDLSASEAVRRRYQLWVFYYPTSLPVVYSAMLLREDVDLYIHQLDPDGTRPALHRAVLVGHSMGGLLSRLAVSEGGERYYHHFFSVPPDGLTMSGEDRALLRRAFARGSANVAHVVFVATPHRGSRLANGPLGGFGRMLLHMPSAVQQRLTNVMVRNKDALTTKHQLRPGSSLDSMSPRGPVIAAINDSTFLPGVRLHSIIGNRGLGGPLEKSSDGVVPYTSSHLPQAESEVIVPAGHTGTLNRPETSAEVIRIVR